MKASFFPLLATLAASAFQTTSALPAPDAEAGSISGRAPEPKLAPFPQGLPDGVYAGNLNEDGTTTWELIDTLNTTALAARAAADANEDAMEKRQGAFGVHCDYPTFVNSNDRFSALNGLADWCGWGGRFFNSRTVSVRKLTNSLLPPLLFIFFFSKRFKANQTLFVTKHLG